MLGTAATTADNDDDGADINEYDCGGGTDDGDSDTYGGGAKSKLRRSA